MHFCEYWRVPLEPELYTCRKYLRTLSSELSLRNYSWHLFNILDNIVTVYEILEIRSYNRLDFTSHFHWICRKMCKKFFCFVRHLIDDSFWSKFNITVLIYIINETKIIEYYICQYYIYVQILAPSVMEHSL